MMAALLRRAGRKLEVTSTEAEQHLHPHGLTVLEQGRAMTVH